METGRKNNRLGRREFIGTSLAAATALVFQPLNLNATPLPGKSRLNSRFGGVRIGAITYSWRSMPGGVENIIKYCTEARISSIELMSNDLELYLGAPQNPSAGQAARRQTGMSEEERAKQAKEREAATAKYNEDLKNWRISLAPEKVKQAKKLFDQAGIKVHIVKFSPYRWSDEEIDYAFRTAKIMGAIGVTDEIGEEAVKRLAPFAEKHKMAAIFHNHMQFATPGFSYDTFLSISPAVRMNFDAGHFFGSTGIHPNEIIRKYHDRIATVHMKDKTGPKSKPANTNVEWGKGETPIADILLLLKKEKWPINVDIELEYPVPEGSDAVKEVKKCVEFCRKILT